MVWHMFTVQSIPLLYKYPNASVDIADIVGIADMNEALFIFRTTHTSYPCVMS